MSEKYIKIAFFALILLNLFFLSAVISFQITKTGEMVTLSDLRGKTIEEARAELSKHKLYAVQTDVQLHDIYEKGKIISQEPPPDSKLKLNQTVKVVVSAGKEKVVVPMIISRTLEAIPLTLQEAGLRKGIVSHVHTSRYAAGKIISQYPIPTQEVGINSKINLLVSQGENEKKYLMPDLLGKKVKVVKAKLEEIGFRIGDIHRFQYPGLESDIIINQTPKQGNCIQKRNIITLEVSK